MPVIIFCKNLEECKLYQAQFKQHFLFEGDNAGALNALLDHFKTLSFAIIITTSVASKGVDFVFAVV
jgi:superfamily II DNA or RNA helicase